MRHYLQVNYNEKDIAKSEAKKNGTKIKWDVNNKKWFWEGGSLPEFLEKYTYNTRPRDYRNRKVSFNSFLNSDAGNRYLESRKNDFLEDMGITENEYIEEKKEYDRVMEEDDKKFKEDNDNIYICMNCLEEIQGKTKKCPECGRKEIEKLF